MTDTVTVPIDLTKAVLQDAINNLHNAEVACAMSDEDHAMFTEQRERIIRLATLAGIDTSNVEAYDAS